MILEHHGITPTLGKDVRILPGAVVIGDTVLEEGCSVWYNSVIRGDVNKIRIGTNSNIQDLSMVHCTTAKYSTTIGREVTIGHRALIHGCTIGDRCLIGMGAIVMDGSVIGEDCIVGAGALVLERSEFPPGSLIVGSPAKLKRPLSSDEIATLSATAYHYRMLAQSHQINE